MNKFSRATAATVFAVSLGMTAHSPEREEQQVESQIQEPTEQGQDMGRMIGGVLLLAAGSALYRDFRRYRHERKLIEEHEVATFRIHQDANHIGVMTQYEFDNEMEIVLRNFRNDTGSAS